MAVQQPTTTVSRADFLTDLHGSTGYNKVAKALFRGSCPKVTKFDGSELEVKGMPNQAEKVAALQDAKEYLKAGSFHLKYSWALSTKSKAIRTAHVNLFNDVDQAQDADALIAALDTYSQAMIPHKVSMKGPMFKFLDGAQTNLRVDAGKGDTKYTGPKRGDAKVHQQNPDTLDARQYTAARKLEIRSTRIDGTREFSTKRVQHGSWFSNAARRAAGSVYYGVGHILHNGFKSIGFFVNSKLNGLGEQSDGEGNYDIGAFVGETDSQSSERDGLTGWGHRFHVTTSETGHFKKFVLDGEGKRKNEHGTQMGKFENGHLKVGTYIDEHGITYHGVFEKGPNDLPRLCQKGTKVLASGLRIDGQFENGRLKDGEVTITDKNKVICKGTCANGELVGLVVRVEGNVEGKLGDDGVWAQND